MILPALALEREVKDAVEQARSQDGEPGVTPAGPRDRDGAAERPDPQRTEREHAVAMAGERLEQRLAAEAAVERQQVADHDVQEGGQRADRGEPDDHERAWQHEAERVAGLAVAATRATRRAGPGARRGA